MTDDDREWILRNLHSQVTQIDRDLCTIKTTLANHLETEAAEFARLHTKIDRNNKLTEEWAFARRFGMVCVTGAAALIAYVGLPAVVEWVKSLLKLIANR